MADDLDIDALTARLATLGFPDKTIKETLKNKKQITSLLSILDEADIQPTGESIPLDPSATPLLSHLASSTKDTALPGRSYISRAIRDGRLKTLVQVDAAIKYVKELPGGNGEVTSDAEFDKACGVGLSFSLEDVVRIVEDYLTEKKAEIEEARYKLLGSTIAAIKAGTELKFASPLEVKNAVDGWFLKVLGPKDERDAPAKKGGKDAKGERADGKGGESSKAAGGGKSKGKAVATAPTAPSDPLNSTSMFEEGFLGSLHKPGGNPQIKPELRDQHLKETGGKVFTRFPPEPNGYLHIGHSKAIAVNFGYARYNKGECYLRYDDTNPEAEEEKYFTSIKEIVEWLGFKPYKITYSSDNFQRLYDLAEDLIKRDKGYVCHCSGMSMNIEF